MLEWLDRIRNKPEHIRFRVAFGAALSITLVIALIWISLLTLRFDDPPVAEVEEKTTQEASPFSAFGEAFSGFFGEISTHVEALTDQFSTIEYEADEGEE